MLRSRHFFWAALEVRGPTPQCPPTCPLSRRPPLCPPRRPPNTTRAPTTTHPTTTRTRRPNAPCPRPYYY